MYDIMISEGYLSFITGLEISMHDSEFNIRNMLLYLKSLVYRKKKKQAASLSCQVFGTHTLQLNHLQNTGVCVCVCVSRVCRNNTAAAHTPGPERDEEWD